MDGAQSLVRPTSNPALEQSLRETLARRSLRGGALGELEPLAARLGLLQGSLAPRFEQAQLLLFAADHGLAVERICDPATKSTQDSVSLVLDQALPLTAFARAHDLTVTVVDCGMSQSLPPHDRLLMRKIAHGTRNTRAALAMSPEQAHAGLRAGMEIAGKLPGNVVATAGLGLGSHESAALVLSRLTDTPVRDFVVSGPHMNLEDLTRVMGVLGQAQQRHREAAEPVDVLAAFGGFEVAVMAGVLLMAASQQKLIVIDGLPACAALLVAVRIAPAVIDYCVFCRSHGHRGLDQALNLFHAAALLEMGLEAADGTGAALAWPLLKSAASLLADVKEPLIPA